MIKSDILLIDFDGIYSSQDFYKNSDYNLVFHNHLAGTNAYCDDYGAKSIEQKLNNYNLPKISFNGSGNYHYLSYFLTKKVNHNYTLILFDNHSDMQKPKFEHLLSCGNWLRQAYETENYLKQIIMVGTNRNYLKVLDSTGVNNISTYDSTLIEKNIKWYFDLRDIIKYPVYISVDKDVFRKNDAITNWDQGSMSIDEFMNVVNFLSMYHHVLGMDVCGEYIANYSDFREFESANDINNKANKLILDAGEEIIK